MTFEPQITQALQHHRAGRLSEAEAIYRQVLAQEPNHPFVLHLLGVLASQCNQHQAAIDLIRRAISIEPHAAQFHCDLGAALAGLGQLDRAIEAYRIAIGMQPDLVDAYNHLGRAFELKGDLAQAINFYQKAIQFRPDHAFALNNLANVLALIGKHEQALQLFREVIRFAPESAEAYNNIANLLRNSGRIEESISAYRRALELRPDSVEIHTNLLYSLNFDPRADAQTISDEHHKWNQSHAEQLKQLIPSHRNTRDSDRRLRIGYVSPDMREHSVGFFLEPLLAHHNHSQVEVFCYPDLRQPDATSIRLQQHAVTWKPITELSNTQVVSMIFEDQIDILIDLAGHTAGNRLLVFAQKPAPVQVTYLGYPNTTGLETIDYRLTDALADPPGMTEEFHSEELVRLPRTFLCYRPSESAPEIFRSESAEITFGSFNTLAKLNSPLIDLWAKILIQVPGARLLLKSAGLDDPASQQMITDRFADHGIARERLVFHGKIPSMAEHLSLYNQIDIALDTYPYHGTTTTCEAMWMGVPVVTLAGKTHASRVGVSLLSNVGLSELIGKNSDEYIAIAVKLAKDKNALSQYRLTLRDRMKASPLMDVSRFAADVERAYRQMWKQWCNSPA